MEILQLKYFCDAAQTQNFSHTAKKYNVPTSCISQSIKRLEAELGVTLFDHGKNRISLNQQGKIFYQGVHQALESLNLAKASLIDSLESVSGEIRLLVCVGRNLLTKKIEQFRTLYPDVTFYLSHNHGNREDFDLIISDEFPESSSYQKKLLVSEAISVAMHREHPLAKKEPFSLSDFKEERFITMQEQCSLSRITTNACRKAGFEPNITIRSDDPYYIRKYVELGLGVALVPQVSWEGTFSSEIILKNTEHIHRDTFVFYRSNTTSKCVRLFLELLFQSEETDNRKEQ